VRIIVLVKSPHAAPQRDETLPSLSPGDRAALATALQLRDESDQAIAVTAGPEADDQALRLALRAGANHAVRVIDPTVRGVDQRTLGTVLAGGLRLVGFDLILAGQSSADWASGGAGPAVAHMLRLPHVTGVVQITRTGVDQELHVRHQRERMSIELLVQPPAVLMMTRGPFLELPAAESDSGTPAESSSETPIELLSLSEMTLPFRRPLVAQHQLRPLTRSTARMLDGIDGLVDLLQRWR